VNRRSYFPHFLGFVFCLFVALMVYVYLGARAANPVILDERGHVRQ